MPLLLTTPPESPTTSALTAPVQLASPLTKNTTVSPSLRTLPDIVTVVAWPVKMYVGASATSGGEGGGEGGGGEGEGGGGEGEGGGGEGEGGGGADGGELSTRCAARSTVGMDPEGMMTSSSMLSPWYS